MQLLDKTDSPLAKLMSITWTFDDNLAIFLSVGEFDDHLALLLSIDKLNDHLSKIMSITSYSSLLLPQDLRPPS